MTKIINNEVRPRRDEFGRIICECCGNHPVDRDNEQQLCENCYEELNRPWYSDFVGDR